MKLTVMNWPRYVPGLPNTTDNMRIPGEYYNSMEQLLKARPELFEGPELSKYHVECV